MSGLDIGTAVALFVGKRVEEGMVEFTRNNSKSSRHFRSGEPANPVFMRFCEIYNLIFFLSSLLKFSHFSEELLG